MNEHEGEGHQEVPDQHIEQPVTPVERLHAAVNNTVPRGDHSHHENATNWPQRIESVCAVMLVVITGFYTYYAAGQLHKLRRAVQAAEGANTIAHDTLIASQRPWVSIGDPFKAMMIEFAPNPTKVDGKPDTANPMGLHSKLSYSIEVAGNSPARRVWGGVSAVVTANDEAPALWQDMGCKASEQLSKGQFRAFFVMPKISVIQTSEGWAWFSKDIKEVKHVWLVGCIVYQDAIGGGLHHTKLLYRSVPNGKPPVVGMTVPYTLTYLPYNGFEMFDSDTD